MSIEPRIPSSLYLILVIARPSIVKRLMETGWEKDLNFLGPYGLERMSRLPVVRQSGKLTEKGRLSLHHLYNLG